MALGGPRGGDESLRVGIMLGALVFAAFLGGALGLLWQSVDLFDEEAEPEVLTGEAAEP